MAAVMCNRFYARIWVLAAWVLLGGLQPSFAAADPDEENQLYGGHHGYTFDVHGERNKRDIEMVMLEPPKQIGKPLREVIFNEKLSKEFQEQYEYRFGKTAAEQVINSPGQSDEYTYYSGKSVTLIEYNKQQRRFGEYMGRRLTEYHVDHWAKSDPAIRPVYQVKDRISNLNMEVKKGYRVVWRYNFSGPSMDLRVENPYEIETKMRVEMNGILSVPEEYIYTMGYPISPRVRLSALYKQNDGVYQLVASRRLTKRVSTSLTGSLDTLRAGPSIQQNLILLGLSWTE